MCSSRRYIFIFSRPRLKRAPGLFMKGENMYLSVSKIKTFENCKLKYKWQYVDKIYKPAPPTEEQLFGSYLHRFLELYKKKEISDIVKLLDEEIGRTEIKDNVLIEAITNTVGFLKRFEGLPSEEEKKVSATFKGIKLGGKIDKLYRNHSLIIIDFKTSKKFYPGFNDLQLKFYSLAMSLMEDIDVSNITNIIYFARPDKYEQKKFSQQDIGYFKEYLLDVAERMNNERNFPAQPNKLCDFCPYKDTCPAFKQASS